MLRRLSLAFLASLSFLSMGSGSCGGGGGGGPQCPPRAGEAASADDPPGSQDEAVDAGPSSDPGDPQNAATNTGGGGGGGPNCPQQ